MPNYDPTPASVADMDPVFNARLKDMQLHAAQAAAAGATGSQVRWYRPLNWAGDLFDLQAFAPPYSSDAANSDYFDATDDPQHPGTSGDIVASTLQIDYLAMLERALRNRHTMGGPRAVAHVLSRQNGHGQELGAYGAMLEQLRQILRLAKEPPS